MGFQEPGHSALFAIVHTDAVLLLLLCCVFQWRPISNEWTETIIRNL